MTYGKLTDWSEILSAIAARAATALGISADYVFPSLDLGDMAEQGGPADTFCVLMNPSGLVSQGEVDGGGNELLAFDGSLQIELWNRLEVDESYRTYAALSHATLGILGQWKLLLNKTIGLQLYSPLPSGGGTQSILKEPMRLLSFDLRPRLPKAGWTKLVSRWEIKFVQSQT